MNIDFTDPALALHARIAHGTMIQASNTAGLAYLQRARFMHAAGCCLNYRIALWERSPNTVFYFVDACRALAAAGLFTKFERI